VTENEGQPRGLWTRFPEDTAHNLGTAVNIHNASAKNWTTTAGGAPTCCRRWITSPRMPSHYATTDGEYEQLAPTALGPKAWEDGDYTALGGGEHFDEKESFRLRQTDDRLADGWNRALRFFITEDPDGETKTFWILSEGA
jgi:hypothetical protein